jgi:hypothetical protein
MSDKQKKKDKNSGLLTGVLKALGIGVKRKAYFPSQQPLIKYPKKN